LLDSGAKAINAAAFLRELRRVVAAYARQLKSDHECWRQFQQKMKAVCANCA